MTLAYVPYIGYWYDSEQHRVVCSHHHRTPEAAQRCAARGAEPEAQRIRTPTARSFDLPLVNKSDV